MTQKRLPTNVKQLLDSFNENFRINYEKSFNMSVLPENAHEVQVARAVLILTAQMYRPLSDEGMEIYKNLQRFI